MHLMFKLTCFNIMPVRFIKSKNLLTFASTEANKYLLLPKSEVRIVCYGPRFSSRIYGPSTKCTSHKSKGKKMRFYNLPYTAQENKIIEIFIIFHYYIFCSFYRANILYLGKREPQVAISSTLIYKS